AAPSRKWLPWSVYGRCSESNCGGRDARPRRRCGTWRCATATLCREGCTGYACGARNSHNGDNLPNGFLGPCVGLVDRGDGCFAEMLYADSDLIRAFDIIRPELACDRNAVFVGDRGKRVHAVFEIAACARSGRREYHHCSLDRAVGAVHNANCEWKCGNLLDQILGSLA